MFKIGDIVVRTESGDPKYANGCIGFNQGDIWKAEKLHGSGTFVYYKIPWSTNKVRKATEDEIKWFEAGITNIHQIPEVGGTFDFVDEEDSTQNCKETIKNINTTHNEIFCSTDNYNLNHYVSWLKNNNVRNYKPPVKSQRLNDKIPIEEPFKPEDLKNCKIGNLTPEDHKIIQPWLFSLGHNWIANEKNLVRHPISYYIVIKNYLTRGNSVQAFNKNRCHEIKKETILNYIKQLNANKNEVYRQNQEITRRPINGSARILSGRQQGSIGSRPKGNVKSVKGRETYFRKSEICGSIRLG